MNELTLQWQEAKQVKTHKIRAQQPSKYFGTVRIGRDLAYCDIVLPEPTVSGLHVEIFFNKQQHCFKLRNLRDTNPPVIDGQELIHGEVTLHQGSIIHLGQIKMTVVAISIAPVSDFYGLECPKCGRIIEFKWLELGCPWDGQSLAEANSVILPR